MMGSGKTTVGRELANKLKVDFLDMDKLIETHEKMSINEIFSLNGEAYFRKIEQNILLESIKQYENCIVSCGGGLPLYGNNLESCLERGKVIYLEAPSNILFGRISADHSRPLVKELAEFENLLSKRNATYKRAHITVDASQPIGDVTKEILKYLGF